MTVHMTRCGSEAHAGDRRVLAPALKSPAVVRRVLLNYRSGGDAAGMPQIAGSSSVEKDTKVEGRR